MGECRAVCSRFSVRLCLFSTLSSEMGSSAGPSAQAVGNSDDPTRSRAPLARIVMIVRTSTKNYTYPSASPALQATREAFFEGWHCRVEGGPTARTALVVNVCIPICDLRIIIK